MHSPKNHNRYERFDIALSECVWRDVAANVTARLSGAHCNRTEMKKLISIDREVGDVAGVPERDAVRSGIRLGHGSVSSAAHLRRRCAAPMSAQ